MGPYGILTSIGGGGGGITSAVTETVYTAASFGGNSFQTVSTTKKIAYILYLNNEVGTDPTYDNQTTPTAATIDIGTVPVSNVIVGYYN